MATHRPVGRSTDAVDGAFVAAAFDLGEQVLELGRQPAVFVLELPKALSGCRLLHCFS